MPRRPRVVLPHIPLHLIQRGNNRQVCFVADEDYRFYLDWLKVTLGDRPRFPCKPCPSHEGYGLPPWGDPVGMLVHAWPAGHRWR